MKYAIPTDVIEMTARTLRHRRELARRQESTPEALTFDDIRQDLGGRAMLGITASGRLRANQEKHSLEQFAKQNPEKMTPRLQRGLKHDKSA